MAEITMDGRRVSYLEYGSGTPIVLLHAGAGSGKQWAKIAALLEPRFRIIAPDLFGFGNTEGFVGETELTHDHQAMLVAGVIRHLCREPVHLVGHSYGGATAVRTIIGRGDLVRTCVLIEPVLMPLLNRQGDERYFDEYRAMATSFLENAAAGRIDDAWEVFLDYRNAPGTWNALAETAKQRFRAGTQATVIGFRSNLNNQTSIEEIERFALPTLVLRGENTTVPDRRVAEILRDHIPLCRYEIIPGAEHMSPLTHPAFIAEAVERHIHGAR